MCAIRTRNTCYGTGRICICTSRVSARDPMQGLRALQKFQSMPMTGAGALIPAIRPCQRAADFVWESTMPAPLQYRRARLQAPLTTHALSRDLRHQSQSYRITNLAEETGLSPIHFNKAPHRSNKSMGQETSMAPTFEQLA